ncbi:hypothetical protein GCM10009867_36470 [Pedococcus aerophilus]|uniref:Uncharacterized protein n=1 Tax=Pedococcus aerophilus TaxID=436356 RepID=A0ABN3UW11_9MICO
MTTRHTDPAPGTLLAPPLDPLTALTACRTRVLEREGIAMFVAVDDLRPSARTRPGPSGRRLSAQEESVRDEGRLLASLLDLYHSGLEEAGFPTDDPDPDETGARELIDALAVLADVHLRAQPEVS